jgi:hypothetical protein
MADSPGLTRSSSPWSRRMAASPWSMQIWTDPEPEIGGPADPEAAGSLADVAQLLSGRAVVDALLARRQSALTTGAMPWGQMTHCRPWPTAL